VKLNGNKTYWIIGIVAVLLIGIFSYIGMYNSLVAMNNDVDAKWSNVAVQYQRRLDLIPNLVNTVQGYATYEQTTLTQITALRSQWQSASTVEQKVQTTNQIESAISKLLVISENYPDLKANANFIALQDELANTENKVAVERTRYNDAVKAYNIKVQSFPSNFVAGMHGFGKRTLFEAAQGAENAPVVNFNK
jgi:LemA protein